jgi:Tfp pilus assembly PilM family ATPase
MGLPLFANGSKKKRDQMLAVDLGGHMTKAVYLQRRGEGFVLCGYAFMDAPVYEKTPSAELLGEHLKAVAQALEAKTKIVALAVGVSDAIVRHVEMPPMPVAEMRLALKNNSKAFLQQDLPNYVFDCYFVPPRSPGKSAEEIGRAHV